MRKLLVISILSMLIFAGVSYAETKDFYIYTDKNSPKNHCIPSGWMGDANDIRFNDQATEESASGATSIKITYTAKRSQGNGWSSSVGDAPTAR